MACWLHRANRLTTRLSTRKSEIWKSAWHMKNISLIWRAKIAKFIEAIIAAKRRLKIKFSLTSHKKSTVRAAHETCAVTPQSTQSPPVRMLVYSSLVPEACWIPEVVGACSSHCTCSDRTAGHRRFSRYQHVVRKTHLRL